MLAIFTRSALIPILTGLIVSTSFADSVNLTSVADTHLYEPAPDNNAGGNATFISGTNSNGKFARGILRFNVNGQIPANATIQSVTLTLVCTEQPFSPNDSTFDLRRMLVDWGEGTGTSASGSGGRLAIAGEATWNHRFHPSTNWSAPGAAAPVDFSTMVSATRFIQGPAAYTFGPTPELIADVQQWLANPSTNFGWILISESEAVAGTHRSFASREAATNRPMLFVQYTVGPPVIKSIQFVSGALQFVFRAVAGQAYTAQYRDSLESGNWATLTTINPQASDTDLIVTDPAPPPAQRFYRITAP